MPRVYGVAIRKGGQGKSTTVATLARLCGLYGARTLVVDLGQPGTCGASLRDIWPETEHGDLSSALLALRDWPAGTKPGVAEARAALNACGLPARLTAQPSWNGGSIAVLPWDDALGDAASFLQSELALQALIAAMDDEFDVVLIDFPAETGPLMTVALSATDSVLMPLAPEAPALEGAAATLRMLARVRNAGHPIELGGILLTRADLRTRRLAEVAQALRQAGEIEGEMLENKILPFAILASEFYEQAFRNGDPVWERTSDQRQWAGYVLLVEWLLRDAGLGQLAGRRRGPAMLRSETRVIDTTRLLAGQAEPMLADFERAHPS
ncbi:MAG TPA: ParA family protein [Ktedonobacterales bacterium]